MSDDERAFLAAVLANPADDTPRLVFADWLDDHEQAERAEFIRVQCELHDLTYAVSGGDAGWHRWVDALRRRERGLLQGGPIGNANWMQWFGSPLPDAAVCDNLNHERTPSSFRFTFRRGFPSSISLTLAQFLGGPCERCSGDGDLYYATPAADEDTLCPDCSATGRTLGLAPALFGTAPIESVTLTDREPYPFRWGGDDNPVCDINPGEKTDGWLWGGRDPRSSPVPYDIGREIVLKLPGRLIWDDRELDAPVRVYDTEAEAWAALVAYGRAVAGGPAPR